MIDVRARMKVDGVHVYMNEDLVMIVDNDPDDLIIRIPSPICSPSKTVFSIEEALEYIDPPRNRQDMLGMTALFGICIFSCFEEQENFLSRISQ